MKVAWFTCGQCGARSFTAISSFNRAKRIGAPLYCDRACAGLARRKGLTAAQKKEAKRLYDIEYQAQNGDKLRAGKRKHHRATYDPVKAAVKRKERMPYHVEYCRKPEYRAKKHEYDVKRNAQQAYGPFADAYLAFRALRNEVRSRINSTESRIENGTWNKAGRRRRESQSTLGRELEGRPVGHPPSRAGR